MRHFSRFPNSFDGKIEEEDAKVSQQGESSERKRHFGALPGQNSMPELFDENFEVDSQPRRQKSFQPVNSIDRKMTLNIGALQSQFALSQKRPSLSFRQVSTQQATKPMQRNSFSDDILFQSQPASTPESQNMVYQSQSEPILQDSFLNSTFYQSQSEPIKRSQSQPVRNEVFYQSQPVSIQQNEPASTPRSHLPNNSIVQKEPATTQADQPSTQPVLNNVVTSELMDSTFDLLKSFIQKKYSVVPDELNFLSAFSKWNEALDQANYDKLVLLDVVCRAGRQLATMVKKKSEMILEKSKATTSDGFEVKITPIHIYIIWLEIQ